MRYDRVQNPKGKDTTVSSINLLPQTVDKATLLAKTARSVVLSSDCGPKYLEAYEHIPISNGNEFGIRTYPDK